MLSRRHGHHGTRVVAYFLAELAALVGAFLVAYEIRALTAPFWGLAIQPLRGLLWLLPITLVLWSGLLWGFNTYQDFRSRSVLTHGFLVGLVCALGVVGLFALLTVTQEYDVNRSFVGLLGLTSYVALFGLRLVASAFLAHYTQQGYDRYYVVVGGTHPRATELAEALEAVRGEVFHVRGVVSERPTGERVLAGRWPVLGTFDDLPALATQDPIDEVYLLPESGSIESLRELIAQCEAIGTTVHLRLTPFEGMLSRLSTHQMAGGDYLTFTTVPHSPAQLALKRAIEVVATLAMLVVLSPLMLVVAALVRLTSRGPAVFRQERAGMNGRVFVMYKFRTMVLGAERERATLEQHNEMDGPVFKIRADPRVTPLGRLLRKTSIDELPQLWNVLRGDMSLVGPRPLPVYEVEKFEPWQRRRLTMRPGITGLWQVSGRNHVGSFADWMRLDLEYVDRWSLPLDFKILLKTIGAVLGGRGAY